MAIIQVFPESTPFCIVHSLHKKVSMQILVKAPQKPTSVKNHCLGMCAGVTLSIK